MSDTNPSRRTFLKVIGAGAVACSTVRLSHAQTPAARPNIVLYVVDDLGTDDAGCYGNPYIRTPSVDALAAEGTRFTQAFCTTPSCSASRSVLLTGMHNHATGQYGHSHDYHHFRSFENLRTLPALLREAGYRTQAAGKFHVAPRDVYAFDTFANHECADTRDPEEMAEQCRPFLEDDADNPFFLYFCTVQPHRPFLRDGATPVSPDEVVVPDYLPDTPEVRDELSKYAMSAEVADKGLGRIVEILKAAAKWDNTVIVFLSDNGIAFPGAKTNLYEPGMRLPCVLRDPHARERGVASDALISWADVTPTLLDYADALPEEPWFHGRSFRPAVGAPRADGFDEVYASHTFHEITMYYPMRVVRGRRYKLIWNIAAGLEYPFASDLYESSTWQAVLERQPTHFGKRTVEAYLHRPKFELYDLETDPHEIVNLIDDPAHADIAADLKQRLRAFQERTKDPWILKWTHE